MHEIVARNHDAGDQIAQHAGHKDERVAHGQHNQQRGRFTRLLQILAPGAVQARCHGGQHAAVRIGSRRPQQIAQLRIGHVESLSEMC